MMPVLDSHSLSLSTIIDRLSHKNQWPNAILLYGENEWLNWDYMVRVCQAVHRRQADGMALPSVAYAEPFPDALVLMPHPTTIRIDSIKQMNDRVQYGARDNGYCTVMIHNAQCMTASAQTALLKTMESPPYHVMFILSACAKHRVLPTIASRCHAWFVPESMRDRSARLQQLKDAIDPAFKDGMDPFEFLAWPLIKKTSLIQSWPNDSAAIRTLLTIWMMVLADEEIQRTSRSFNFLHSVIEIIQNMTYNINIKLQLLAAILQFEERDH